LRQPIPGGRNHDARIAAPLGDCGWPQAKTFFGFREPMVGVVIDLKTLRKCRASFAAPQYHVVIEPFSRFCAQVIARRRAHFLAPGAQNFRKFA
jgi:hypothetical protein